MQIVSYEKVLSGGELLDYDGHMLLPQCTFKRFLLDKNQDFELNMDLLKLVNEHIVEKLYPYQKEVVAKMIQRKRCWSCLDMGTGKTLTSIAAASALEPTEAGFYDVVICPSYLKKNWLNEFGKWYASSQPFIVETKKHIEKIVPGQYVIVSYDMAFHVIKHVGGKLNTVICDESHYLKSHKTKRFLNIYEAIQKCKHLFMLTGTPVPNRPEELFSQLALIVPDVFRDYYAFARRYCDGKLNHFKQFEARGSTNVAELSFLMSKVAIRVRREDVLDDLPEFTRSKVTLEQRVNRDFDKKFREFKLLVRQPKPDTFKMNSMISELFRMTSKIKEDVVMKYLTECVDFDEKVIIFCKHVEFGKKICETLEAARVSLVYIDGSTPMNKRSEMIETFLDSDTVSAAVLTLGSCSTGLNLVPVTKMIFTELDWSPSTLMQAECRINRIGAAPNLEYTYLLCDNTLDAYVYNKVFNKASLSIDIVDRGDDYDDLKAHIEKKARLE